VRAEARGACGNFARSPGLTLQLVLCLPALVALAPAKAEVTLDGSLGPRGALEGPHYQILQQYGQTVGSNLFHSFGKFNLETGTAATFSGSPTIDNIVGRVTGGTRSSIDGLLHSAIPGANLWLVNPGGVVFGPHASINVDGSFYVSTAHYLKFADGLKFDATGAASPVLSSAAPEAFGFLGGKPAPIEFNGSGSSQAGDYAAGKGLPWNGMKVPDGRTFAVVGGDILIQDGHLASGETVAAKLQAPSGRLAIASVASAGEVKPDAEDIDGDSFGQQGSVAIGSTVVQQGALLTASGEGGGEVVIRGGELTLDNAYLVSNTTGVVDGKRIDVDVSGNIAIRNNAAGIYAGTGGAGKGSDIVVSAGNGLVMSNGAAVATATLDEGEGGKVDIQAGTFVGIASGSWITSTALGKGSAGSVLVQAPLISVRNRAGFHSETKSEGRGGDIRLEADDIELTGGAIVLSEAKGTGGGGSLALQVRNLLFGDQASLIQSATSGGAGGSITVKARDVLLDNKTTMMTTSDGPSAAGKIDLESDTISLNTGSQITSGTKGSGGSGDIAVKVKDLITLSSYLQDIPSGIFNNSLGSGGVGATSVTSKLIDISDFAQIGGSSSGAGDASDIFVSAETLVISGNGRIESTSTSTGSAGDIDLDVSVALGIQDGGKVVSNAFGQGDGGNISISSPSVLMRNGLVEAGSLERGNSGNISISSGDLWVVDDSLINTSTAGRGAGGNVDIQSTQVFVQKGGILAGTEGAGEGGDINVLGRESVLLAGRAAISSDTQGVDGVRGLAGPGGSIRVETPDLTLANGSEISSLTIGDGNAGQVTLTVGKASLDNGGQILATSGFIDHTGNFVVGTGSGGDILITATGDVDLNSSDISATTLGTGHAGNISIQASNLSTNFSTIQSLNFEYRVAEGKREITAVGAGDGGKIAIDARESILADSASLISTSTASTGKAGSIGLTGKSVSVNNLSFVASTSLFEADAKLSPNEIGDRGKAGEVLVSTNSLSLSNSSVISAETVDGRGGSIDVRTDQLSMAAGGAINTTTTGFGNAGNISAHGLTSSAIRTTKIIGVDESTIIDLPGGNKLGQFSGFYLNTQGNGKGGSLDLKTDQLSVTDGGLISAIVAFGGDQTTQGGDIDIVADSVQLKGGGLISAATSGAGKAGNVSVKADDAIVISGTFDRSKYPEVTNPRISDLSGINNSATRAIDPQALELGAGGSIKIQADQLILSNRGEISASTQGSGKGGDIVIKTGDLTSRSGGTIASTSTGSGLAGNIDIDAGKNFHSTNGRITAEARESDGGNITLKAIDSVHLIDSAITTSVGSGEGKGGNIFIDPRFVILDNSRITAQAFGGPGGNIRIVADNFIQSPDSLVSSSSRFGVDGTVVIDSPDTNIIGKTNALKTPFIDPAALFKQQCAARYAGGQSTLVVTNSTPLKAPPGEVIYSADYEKVRGESPRRTEVKQDGLQASTSPSPKCETH